MLYNSSVGVWYRISFSVFFNRQGYQNRFFSPPSLDPDFGTEEATLSVLDKEDDIVHSIPLWNGSAALSLLNIVRKSI